MVVEGLFGVLLQYNDIVSATWVLALTFLVGKSLFIIFKRYILGVHREEGDNLNVHVASEVSLSFYSIVTAVGLYYALRALDILAPYRSLIKDIFIVFGIVLGALITRKIVNTVVVWYASKDNKRFKIEKTALMSLKNLMSIFIVAIAGMVILDQFGIEITPLLASLGIGGLAIALALQPTLSNYFAGMYIASDKTVRLGDFVELNEEQRGYVEKMTWRTVWIRTILNNMIVIPNSKLAETTIINYSQPKGPMMIKIPVGVAYSSDLDKVERVALRVARRIGKKTGGMVEKEEPFVRFKEFGESNINFVVFFKIKSWINRYELSDEYIKALHKEFKKEGIVISFPCRNIYTRG